MTFFWGLLGLEFAVAFGVSAAAAIGLQRIRRFRATNYRGEDVPVVLGVAVAIGLLFASQAAGGLAILTNRGVEAKVTLVWIAMYWGALAVAAGGLSDDLRLIAGTARGLRGHVGELASGHLTSGIVKLAVASVAALIVIIAADRSIVVSLLGLPVVAGCANLWNLLDIRPGRCLKYFVPVTGWLFLLHPRSEFHHLGAAALGGALAVFPFDLRERGMLGDAGSNLLGFVVGMGVFLHFGPGGLAGCLAVILALHAVAETVSLSRVIRAAPPLRWFDDLGRVRHPESEGSTST